MVCRLPGGRSRSAGRGGKAFGTLRMSILRVFPLLLALAACAAHDSPPARQAAAALHWTIETTEGRFLGSATSVALAAS